MVEISQFMSGIGIALKEDGFYNKVRDYIIIHGKEKRHESESRHTAVPARENKLAQGFSARLASLSPSAGSSKTPKKDMMHMIQKQVLGIK